MDLHKNLIIATQLFAETLPISSSTHVWLVDFLWSQFSGISTPAASEAIMDLLFLPTLLVLLYYFKTHTRHALKTLNSFFHTPTSHHIRWLLILLRIAGYLIASTLAFTAIFYSFRFLLGNSMKFLAGPQAWIAQALGLGVTALLQLSTYFRSTQQQNETHLSLSKAIIIGLFQGFAALPGISRLSITLVTARWLNIPPHRAFEFSTLLQITVFLGNLCKNIIIPNGSIAPSQGIRLYTQTFELFSFDNLIIIALFTLASYQGLRLTKELNTTKSLWKISPYFAIPIGILLFAH